MAKRVTTRIDSVRKSINAQLQAEYEHLDRSGAVPAGAFTTQTSPTATGLNAWAKCCAERIGVASS